VLGQAQGNPFADERSDEKGRQGKVCGRPDEPASDDGQRQVAPGDEQGNSAPTGRIIRAGMFATPVTMMEVEMAPGEPQDRKAASVTATPAAPPPGRKLPADDPHRFTMIARSCRRPGNDPVSVNV
jgi:hypothetical protein